MPDHVERVYIAGYKYDVRYARCCVASIRQYYQDIPITLIKDRFYGEYWTKDIEEYWNVDVLDIGDRVFSWGFSKFEPLFLEKKERVLVVDADIVMLGPVLSLFKNISEEFIVSGHNVEHEFQTQQYYDLEKIKEFDPEFEHPGYAFNSGQMVLTSGIFTRNDLDPFVRFTNPPSLRQENLFQYGDQGLFNYFLFKQQQLRQISLKSIPFMESGEYSLLEKIKANDIGNYTHKPLIIHWAGIRGYRFSNTPAGHILQYFENRFYQEISFGYIKKYARFLGNQLLQIAKRYLKVFLGK